MPDTVALIVAAGRGHRAAGPVPKQYLPLAGEPMLRRAVLAFLDHPEVDASRVVIHPDDRALYDEAVHGLDLLEPVEGGDERQESVRRGLEALAALVPDLVLIHDAARPLVGAETIQRSLAALATAPAAIVAVPVRDTLKRVGGAHGVSVQATVAREALWRAQTPQAFRFDAILAAHRAAAGAALPDDAAVAERAGIEVVVVEGSEDNLKVTTAQDFARAERLLAGAATGETRVGSGFDAHRFAARGDHLMLCGVRVAHERGLLGHSDADVGLHALVDALLGALGAGDIGTHFPSSDRRWKDADSAVFVDHARALAAAAGATVANLDLTVICERPRLGAHRSAMCARIAALLAIPESRVSVKATTTDGLGFTGRREGIAAHAVVSLRFGR
jgi:2-C-methyl-D-erythritol 4-phosphate cytidylyltransferase/2-C-methyl-D-erythritol 2,4-cyclodiphosphate synthase